MSNERKDEEMICALTADERDVLQRGLAALPETSPPRVVWERIRAQAEAEGLIRQSLSRRPSTWYVTGLAAAIALAAIIAPGLLDKPAIEPGFSATPPVDSALNSLMAESQQLESNLRALPASPGVMRASTAATISELEDRIAAIDFQLNDTRFQLSAEDEEIFWRERVRLMKSLIQLRYAQAQRSAF
jgi:hypothetical protein